MWRPSQYGLDSVLENWRSLKIISIREGVANSSLTGGQGYQQCKCTTACRTKICSCFRMDRVCNSRCHPKSGNCLNHDDCNRDHGSSSDDEDLVMIPPETQPPQPAEPEPVEKKKKAQPRKRKNQVPSNPETQTQPEAEVQLEPVVVKKRKTPLKIN